MTDWQQAAADADAAEAIRLRTVTRICISACVMAIAMPVLIFWWML